MNILSIILLTSLSFKTLANVQHNIRIDHAKELMGPKFNKSIVFKVGMGVDFEKNIRETVYYRLPKKFKHRAQPIAHTIIEEAAKHGLDPYFVMAVISGESSFNPEAIGPVGEIGMMQIRPRTGKWIAEIIKTPWKGDGSLKDPIFNIKLGTAYLSWLREKFNGHGQLYLAAYNMGAESVKKAVSKKVWPKDYPRHVMKRYVAFYRNIHAKL